MKTVIIFLLLFTLTSFKIANRTVLNRSTKWLISETSSLVVNGSTNINKFSCNISRYQKTDTIFISQDKTNSALLNGTVNIEVKNFDCSNYMMTKELRKTLKANEFPYLHIKFLSLKQVTSINQKDNMKGFVEIEIAGVNKRFEISYQLIRDKNKMVLIGNQPINFSHFNLLPPKKMGKLVRAKDELLVAFCLTMEAI